ncbi:MAG: hypothetical protein AMJ94_06525 [Deltaproteobacteria bacterium SM23_61]|nr:MAG: hypothetical protein AMJ94_06525 [Deltaproteobacteria bacterium SM23_61]
MEYWNDGQKKLNAETHYSIIPLFQFSNAFEIRLFQGLFFISTLAIRESQGAKAEKESFELRVSSFRLIAPGMIFSRTPNSITPN